jgi:hypothetical protein
VEYNGFESKINLMYKSGGTEGDSDNVEKFPIDENLVEIH